MSKPRYDEEHSKIGAVKRRDGIPEREGMPWTHEDLDRGLTLYLDGRAEKTIAKCLQRSRRAVETKLMHHIFDPKDNPTGYIPRYLGKSRAGKHWGKTDTRVLKLAMKHNWDLKAIATVLARTEDAVRIHIEERQSRGQPTMFGG